MQDYKPLPDDAIATLATIAKNDLSVGGGVRAFCQVLPEILFSVGDMAAEIKDLRAQLGVEVETPE